MNVIKIEGLPDIYEGEHEFSARVGKLNKQPVVFIGINKDRTIIVGYDTLSRIIDLLCRKKEDLKESLLANIPEISTIDPVARH